MAKSSAEGAVQAAAQGLIEEGEVIVSWVMTIDVAGPDGVRYIAHRAGGGADGDEPPTMWSALGMFEASGALAREQILETTREPPEDESEPEED